MKIAIYSGEIPSTPFVEQLVRGLSERGYTVLLFGTKKEAYEAANKNIRVHYFPGNIVSLGLIFLANFFRLLVLHPDRFVNFWRSRNNSEFNVDYCCRYQNVRNFVKHLIVLNDLPDIFHIQWIKQGHEWLFLRSLGVKVVGSFRGAHINYSPVADDALAEIYRKTFPLYDGFHAVSEDISREGQKYGALSQKIFRIPGAVNDDILKNDHKVELHRNKSTINLLSIGREHWIKGYRYSIEACKILVDRGFNIRYTIVGAKNNEELLYLVNDMGLNGSVFLIDNVPHEEIFKYYRRADIFIMSSLKEGIPNVILEAMALGVPVVSSDCGGVNEVIKTGESGWIVPVRDPQALVKILIDIIKGVYDINEIVFNAREIIRKNHLETKQLNAFDAMYKKIYGNKVAVRA
jgi:colanic acid/amylovoran biosynthesis glycosyltransferase